MRQQPRQKPSDLPLRHRELLEILSLTCRELEAVVVPLRIRLLVSNLDIDLVILRDDYEVEGFSLPEMIKLIKPDLPVLALVPMLMSDGPKGADLSIADSGGIVEAVAKLLLPQ